MSTGYHSDRTGQSLSITTRTTATDMAIPPPLESEASAFDGGYALQEAAART